MKQKNIEFEMHQKGNDFKEQFFLTYEGHFICIAKDDFIHSLYGD